MDGIGSFSAGLEKKSFAAMDQHGHRFCYVNNDLNQFYFPTYFKLIIDDIIQGWRWRIDELLQRWMGKMVRHRSSRKRWSFCWMFNIKQTQCVCAFTSLKPITTTPTTTRDPSLIDCQDKPDSSYANPASTYSTSFYMCSNGNAYLFVSLFFFSNSK